MAPRRTWFVLALLALGTFPGSAEAQGPVATGLTVALDEPSVTIDPNGAVSSVSGLVTLESQAPVTGSVRVQLSLPEVPGWATAVLEPDAVDVSFVPGSSRGSAPFTLRVVTESGPALVPEALVVAADAPGDPVRAPAHAETSLNVLVGFDAALDVTVSETALALRTDTPAYVGITLRNLGNGPQKVWLEPVDVPASVQVRVPQPVHLDSPRVAGSGSESLVVPLTFLAADGLTENGQRVTVVVRHHFMLDRNLVGEDVPLEFMVWRAQPSQSASGYDAWPASTGRTSLNGNTWAPATDEQRAGGLRVQSSPGGDFALPDLRPAVPLMGAVAGAWVGLVLARRRLGP